MYLLEERSDCLTYRRHEEFAFRHVVKLGQNDLIFILKSNMAKKKKVRPAQNPSKNLQNNKVAVVPNTSEENKEKIESHDSGKTEKSITIYQKKEIDTCHSFKDAVVKEQELKPSTNKIKANIEKPAYANGVEPDESYDDVFKVPLPPQPQTSGLQEESTGKKSTKKKKKPRSKQDLDDQMETSHRLYKKRIKDPKLIHRIVAYLDTVPNKNFISIPSMAEYLQNRYHDYSRKKKGPFREYVDKAYAVWEKNGGKAKNNRAEKHKGKKGTVPNDLRLEPDDEALEFADSDSDGDIQYDSSQGDDDVEVDETQQDDEEMNPGTNAVNNMMSNLYKNSPHHLYKSKEESESRGLKRKHGKEDHGNKGHVKPEFALLDDEVEELEDKMDEDEEDSLKGDSPKKGENSQPISRDTNIKKFLGALPSRTSYSAYVNSKSDPRTKSGTLYRVQLDDNITEDPSRIHSGISDENQGISGTPPQSPDPTVEVMDTSTVQDIPDPRLTSHTTVGPGTGPGGDNRLVVVDQSARDRKGSKTPKPSRRSSKRVRRNNGGGSDTEPDGKQEKPDKGLEVQKSTVTFADVGGNEKCLTEICKLLVHMRHPEVYQQLGVTPPRGFLLHGPPGCGKTLLANAIAGLAATEIVSGVSGDSEEKIRDLFEKAQQTAPCVIFIDEIDAITPKRETASKDMERRIVAQLLACMDATNRADSLDPALRRAGRFDREIALGIPDEEARLRILQVLCRGLRLHEDFAFQPLAHSTPGYVGADLMALTREAAISAVNRVFQMLQKDKINVTENITNATDDNTNITEDITNITDASPPAEVFVTNNSPSGADSVPAAHVDASCGGKQIAIDANLTSMKFAKAVSGYALVSVKEAPVGSSLEVSDKTENNSHSDKENEPAIDKPDMETLNECSIKSFTENMETSDTHEVPADVEAIKDKKSVTDKILLNPVLTNVNGQKFGSCENKSSDSSILPCTEGEPKVSGGTDNDTLVSKAVAALSWLKDTPPLTEDQLKDLYITMADFQEALKCVQPSAKREGFATVPDVTWDDIGALKDVREELQLAILAIANETGINFISVKGPELLNMYVGESERAVRTVFQRARNSSPCVIFFDELDALCPKRSGHSEGNSSARVVNQLLTEMDGLEERRQVFIMAATNRPDIIDPAVLRPGRLDKTLYVGLPTEADRLDILTCITKNGTRPTLDPDVELAVLSGDSRCQCLTGADLAALVREASVFALKAAILKHGAQPSDTILVNKQHFELAFRKIRPSVSAKSPPSSPGYVSMPVINLTHKLVQSFNSFISLIFMLIKIRTYRPKYSNADGNDAEKTRPFFTLNKTNHVIVEIVLIFWSAYNK
ncbi:NVL-like protein [Mya arenaria]|uniref:NVL-like protein n=1 Tax=Mya arenaria TaxID=6604 RepID=A0ABY7DIR8_MYAAR|nr:NVL-like protein [Mya arenaria]